MTGLEEMDANLRVNPKLTACLNRSLRRCLNRLRLSACTNGLKRYTYHCLRMNIATIYRFLLADSGKAEERAA